MGNIAYGFPVIRAFLFCLLGNMIEVIWDFNLSLTAAMTNKAGPKIKKGFCPRGEGKGEGESMARIECTHRIREL